LPFVDQVLEVNEEAGFVLLQKIDNLLRGVGGGVAAGLVAVPSDEDGDAAFLVLGPIL
jgi:hypothetical protein